MYKCNKCGEVIDENEIETHDEMRGECFGYHNFESIADECRCGGDYEEAYECKVCEEYFIADEMRNDICYKCLDKLSTFDNAIKIGKNNTQKIMLNGYLAYEFTVEEIEEILLNELKKYKNNNLKDYCDSEIDFISANINEMED